MNNYRELKVWQDSIQLVMAVYDNLKDFPSSERFGLIDQIRRSAVSIPSNIAEGAGRHGQKEFARFLSIASGSASELSTQIEIATRLGFITEVNSIDLNEKITSIHKMIYGLQAAVRRTIKEGVNDTGMPPS